jgi:hypothetical protein
MEVIEGQRLAPLDPYTAELIDTRLKPGARYKVTVVGDRSPGKLRLYWAGLGLLHENLPAEDSERWPTTTALSKMLLEALGFKHREYYLDHRSEDGVGWREVADSIALDNMDEHDFNTYFENVRAIAVSRWGWDPFEAWTDRQEAYQNMRRGR